MSWLSETFDIHPEVIRLGILLAGALAAWIVAIPVAFFGSSLAFVALSVLGLALFVRAAWKFFGDPPLPTPAEIRAKASAIADAVRAAVRAAPAVLARLGKLAALAGVGGLVTWGLAAALGMPVSVLVAFVGLAALTLVGYGVVTHSLDRLWAGTKRAGGVATALGAAALALVLGHAAPAVEAPASSAEPGRHAALAAAVAPTAAAARSAETALPEAPVAPGERVAPGEERSSRSEGSLVASPERAGPARPAPRGEGVVGMLTRSGSP